MSSYANPFLMINVYGEILFMELHETFSGALSHFSNLSLTASISLDSLFEVHVLNMPVESGVWTIDPNFLSIVG